MAKLDGGFGMLGSLGNMSIYKMRGVDKPVIRTKGGPSKEKIKRSPKFANTRKVNKEFGVRASASKWIMHMLWPQKPLADYNIAGPLNALLMPIQKMDTQSDLGQRGVLLSKQPEVLNGFSLNKKMPFDSVIRCPLQYTLSRETLSARINIQALIPDINLFLNNSQPLFSIKAVLGIVPDIVYKDKMAAPTHGRYTDMCGVEVISEWYTAGKGSPAITLDIKYPQMPPNNDFTLLLSVGLRYGTIEEGGVIGQVKYTGHAKVLATA